MKKITITLIFILLTGKLFSQDSFPRIEKIIVEDKIIKGQIDKYPITIYLKFYKFSNNHLGVYSVDGWYYYDNLKIKIPLTGIYEYSELTLYNFKDSSNKRSEILNFTVSKKNHWEDMKYYKNIESYNEKFILSDKESYWSNNKTKLELKLNRNNFKIRNVTELLVLNSNNAFDLNNFGQWTWNFEIEASKSGKIILKYTHGSRLYVQGRCGAGLEKGFLLLEFDKENKLRKFEEFIIESCNNSISSEKLKNENNNIRIYKCYNYGDDKPYELKINLKEVIIEKN